jgi:hypothetical protein
LFLAPKNNNTQNRTHGPLPIATTMMAQQYHEEAVEEQQEEQGLSSGVSGNML